MNASCKCGRGSDPYNVEEHRIRWLVGSRSERRQTFWPYPIQPRRGGIVHQTERLAHDNVSKDAIAGSRADKEGPHSLTRMQNYTLNTCEEFDALIEDGYTHATREPGDGVQSPNTGDVVVLAYVASLWDSTQTWLREFASSDEGDGVLRFVVGEHQVIAALEKCVVNMTVGERCIVTVAPSMGYGSAGCPPLVPPPLAPSVRHKPNIRRAGERANALNYAGTGAKSHGVASCTPFGIRCASAAGAPPPPTPTFGDNKKRLSTRPVSTRANARGQHTTGECALHWQKTSRDLFVQTRAAQTCSSNSAAAASNYAKAYDRTSAKGYSPIYSKCPPFNGRICQNGTVSKESNTAADPCFIFCAKVKASANNKGNAASYSRCLRRTKDVW